MFVVALEFNTRLGQSDDSAKELEFPVVSVCPSRDLNLKFVLLSEMVAEPLELVTFSCDKGVIDVDDFPQVTLRVSEDTIGDLALFKPNLLHVTLDYGETCEWGITGPV